MEKRKCSFCNKEIDVRKTKNQNEFKFVPHRRKKTFSDDEDNGESRVHCRNIPDILCEGSGLKYLGSGEGSPDHC